MRLNSQFFMIKNIHDKFESRGNSECQQVGLTLSQFRVLLYLDMNPDKQVTQRELELEFKVSHPTITGILKRMEEKEFISTKIIRDGKQQKLVFITDKGRDCLEFTNKSLKKDDEAMSRMFSPEELAQLDNYLNRILDYLNNE